MTGGRAELRASTAGPDRAELRARVFLRAVLPLLEVIAREQPAAARLVDGLSASVQLEVARSGMGAVLRFGDRALQVEPGVRERAEVRCVFRDLGSLNAFFSGKPALPRVTGLRHPILLYRCARLLSMLRVLDSEAAARWPFRRSWRARALRVKLLLLLVTRALAELHRGGHPGMLELAEGSPDRVYQWTVRGTGIGAYLRMRDGRVKAGWGAYARRRPFVHFVFADVDAALAVLTATGSQVDGVRDGLLQTLGSPEYTRKIALLMQKVDELLRQG